jgi:hypothetical protein
LVGELCGPHLECLIEVHERVVQVEEREPLHGRRLTASRPFVPNYRPLSCPELPALVERELPYVRVRCCAPRLLYLSAVRLPLLACGSSASLLPTGVRLYNCPADPSAADWCVFPAAWSRVLIRADGATV